MGKAMTSDARDEAIALVRATMTCALEQLDALGLSLVAAQQSLARDTLDRIDPSTLARTPAR